MNKEYFISGFALNSLDDLPEAAQAIEAQYIEYAKTNEITFKRSWQIEIITLDLAKRDLFVGHHQVILEAILGVRHCLVLCSS